MLAYQAGLAEQLVRHARAHVPYYRDHGRLDVLFTPDDKIDWNRWEEVPVLTRVEAQKNAEALYSEFIPENCGPVITGYTTGSTGTPLRYRITANLADVGSAMIERGYVWAGMPAGLAGASADRPEPGMPIPERQDLPHHNPRRKASAALSRGADID